MNFNTGLNVAVTVISWFSAWPGKLQIRNGCRNLLRQAFAMKRRLVFTCSWISASCFPNAFRIFSWPFFTLVVSASIRRTRAAGNRVFTSCSSFSVPYPYDENPFAARHDGHWTGTGTEEPQEWQTMVFEA